MKKYRIHRAKALFNIQFNRPTWKDKDNSFRKDKDCHLSVIPTLIRWKNPQRLEGDQLLKSELLQMFFADED